MAVINVVSYAFKLFIIFPPIDIAVHMISGATLAAIGFFILDKKPRLVLPATFLLLLLWEALEMAGDRLFPQFSNCAYLFCHADVFFWDGFFDVLFGIAAAGIVTIIFLKYKK